MPELVLEQNVVFAPPFPPMDAMVQWAHAAFPGLSNNVIHIVKDVIFSERKFALERSSRPPGIGEYLDCLRALASLADNEHDQLRYLNTLSEFVFRSRPHAFDAPRVPILEPKPIPVPTTLEILDEFESGLGGESENDAIFISYASSVEQDFVEQLYELLKKKGINAKLDKIDLSYRESLGNYIDKLGKGAAIVVIVSDKYLRSPWCMWELLKIHEAEHFQTRVFPVVMGDAKISDGIGRLEYAQYWENRLKEFDAAMRKVDPLSISSATVAEGKRIRDFAGKVDLLASMVADMNFRSMNDPSDKAMGLLCECLVTRLDELKNVRR